MDIKKIIDKHYQIGLIKDTHKTVYGSGNTFVVVTDEGRYIAKLQNKVYEIALYDRVQNSLQMGSIKHPKIIHTVYGNLISPEGLVLFEYINGKTHRFFNGSLENKAIEAIYEYNQHLKMVSYNISEFSIDNDWDRIKYLNYICEESVKRIIELQIDASQKDILLECIDILSREMSQIQRLEKQIIHSDLGADNFIVENNEIKAIIDFTPDINNELYSVAQFVYWNYLWRTDQPKRSSINKYLEQYYKNNKRKCNYHDFHLLLLNASVYRILGPMFQISESEEKDYSVLIKRFDIASWIKEELFKNE